LLSEVDRRVLPVVVEALAAAHVADLGVGHHDALQPARDLGRDAGRLEVGDAHQIAQRQHSGHSTVVDDGHVPIAALAHAQQGLAALVGPIDRVNRHRHRLAHCDRRRAAVGVEAQHVALGHDPDGVLFVVDHHHGTDAQSMHPVDQLDEGFVGAGGDRRRRHQCLDRPRHEAQRAPEAPHRQH
jgi:hypothetical protein